eukprot:COSAG06_NODE_16262_length_1010_cov_1.208562_2_plen_76_part_00
MKGYYDAIGHAPPLPDWALGFWASKERYSSQAEIVEVVTNYTEIHGAGTSFVHTVFILLKPDILPRQARDKRRQS